jgi:hypothetical protein
MTDPKREHRSTRLSNRTIAFGLVLVAVAFYVAIALRARYGAL